MTAYLILTLGSLMFWSFHSSRVGNVKKSSPVFPRRRQRRTISSWTMSILRRVNMSGLMKATPHLPRTSMPRARAVTEIRSPARSHTRTALNVLVGVMRSKDATATAKVSAANAILDRGWGKAAQAIENGGEGPLELIHKIERIIVHPENPDSENI
jgi:hypothetical protein